MVVIVPGRVRVSASDGADGPKTMSIADAASTNSAVTRMER